MASWAVSCQERELRISKGNSQKMLHDVPLKSNKSPKSWISLGSILEI